MGVVRGQYIVGSCSIHYFNNTMWEIKTSTMRMSDISAFGTD